MRIALLLVCAACELEPAPKQAPPPPGGSATVTPTPAPPPVQPAPGAPRPRVETTQACIDVGVRIADFMIAEADGTAKLQLEQERATNVRTIAEGCTTQHWSDAVLDCYAKAKSRAELAACEKLVAPPTPAAH